VFAPTFEGVEYKYRVEKGGSFVHAWTAAAAGGVFVAPTPGVHGWFWENTSSTRVTVTLKVSGFFTASTGVPRRRTARAAPPVESASCGTSLPSRP